MTETKLELATLGGGCFWCLEAVFEQVNGVVSVVSGYAGGDGDHPSYAEVCSGATGHAEVVQVAFDPSVIGYRSLLEVFFAIHDPTTLNRQGADIGSQYRSVVFHHTEAQRKAAEQYIARLQAEGNFTAPLVTQVLPAGNFFPAEGGHQHYYATHPEQAYCQAVVAPKVAKFRKLFRERIKATR